MESLEFGGKFFGTKHSPTERFKSSAVEESSIAFDSLESNVHRLLIDWKGNCRSAISKTIEVPPHPISILTSFIF